MEKTLLCVESWYKTFSLTQNIISKQNKWNKWVYFMCLFRSAVKLTFYKNIFLLLVCASINNLFCSLFIHWLL